MGEGKVRNEEERRVSFEIPVVISIKINEQNKEGKMPREDSAIVNSRGSLTEPEGQHSPSPELRSLPCLGTELLGAGDRAAGATWEDGAVRAA